MITPIMPDIIGLPPTTATAKGKSSSPYHGFNMKDKTTDIPLNIPKKHPKLRRVHR